MTIYYTILRTNFRNLPAARTDKGICFVGLSIKELRNFLQRNKDKAVFVKNDKVLGNLQKDLSSYFSGKKVNFSSKLDLTGTTFQKKVWKTLRQIPYGYTVSYEKVARKVGGRKFARAVGNACGTNPVPIIIPCHRVINKDLSLGGYGGRPNLKRQLLALERKAK